MAKIILYLPGETLKYNQPSDSLWLVFSQKLRNRQHPSQTVTAAILWLPAVALVPHRYSPSQFAYKKTARTSRSPPSTEQWQMLGALPPCPLWILTALNLDTKKLHISTDRPGDVASTLASFRKVPALNIHSETGYTEWGISWFSSVTPSKCRDSNLTLGHDRFLPNQLRIKHPTS
jgi:hypothetical protein